MHKEILINSTDREVRIALMEDHELVEFSVERADAKRSVGNVYKGRVTAVRPGLQAAFVDIGMDKAGFLHVSDLIHDSQEEDDDDDGNNGRGGRGGRGGGRRKSRREGLKPIETMLKEGDEILVQVTKEIIGTKGPRLTADISLPGRFLVLMPKGEHVGVSRKIDDRNERGRLKEMLNRLRPKDLGGSWIIRTAGAGIDEKMLERDMEYLGGLWKGIQQRAREQQAKTCVHEDVGLIVGLVRDIFKEDVDSLVIDNQEDHDRLVRYLRNFSPEMEKRVRMYTDPIPILDKYGVEAELRKTLDKKVWMKRGGFLVIEQTEALVSIDVNTGRYTGKKNQEETILRTNMLAAREVPRQLRLRDLGGIIVIDFIDMESEENKKKVLNELRTHLRRDRSRTKTFGVSDLGLIEMSRQRSGESLKSLLSDECPFCQGTGQILSIDTLTSRVERMLVKLAVTTHERSVQVQANPTLALALMGERKAALDAIAAQHGLKVDVLDDARLHREEFRIVSLVTRKDLVKEIEKTSGNDAVQAAKQVRREEKQEERRTRGGRGGERRRSDRSDRGERGDRRERGERGERGGRGRGRGRGDGDEVAATKPREERPSAAPAEATGGQDQPQEGGGRRRRRRRGGRGRRRRGGSSAEGQRREDLRHDQYREDKPRAEAAPEPRAQAAAAGSEEQDNGEGRRRERPRREERSRRREGRGADADEAREAQASAAEADHHPAREASRGDDGDDGGPRRRRRRGGRGRRRSGGGDDEGGGDSRREADAGSAPAQEASSRPARETGSDRQDEGDGGRRRSRSSRGGRRRSSSRREDEGSRREASGGDSSPRREERSGGGDSAPAREPSEGSSRREPREPRESREPRERRAANPTRATGPVREDEKDDGGGRRRRRRTVRKSRR